MNEEKKPGTILDKKFKNDDFVLIRDDSNGNCYYYFKKGVSVDFDVDAKVTYTLAIFTDGNRPIVIDVE